MSIGPLIVDIGLVCVLSAFLLHHYGNWRKQHILVTIATFVSWYFSFMIIFMLPLDVSSTFYRQCLHVNEPPTTLVPQNESTTVPLDNVTVVSNGSSTTTATPVFRARREAEGLGTTASSCEVPWSFVPAYVLPSLWHVVYWTSQVLTWLILPLMQSYANAGDFTAAGKIKSALIENAIYYGSYLLIFGICLIYVAARPDIHFSGDKLKVIGITASNTWGLFLLVFLLGYGLVEVPRTVWYNSTRGHQLTTTYFKLAKLSTERTESEENLEDVLEDIRKASEVLRYNNPLRKHVDTVIEKCPEEFQKSVKRGAMDDFQDYEEPRDLPSEKYLVKLHKKVIAASQNYHRTHCQWDMLVQKAYDLEDIESNLKSPDRRFKRSYGKYQGFFKLCHSPSVEWYWKCLFQSWVLKIVSVILAIFSMMVVWSEVTFFNKKPVLSLFAIFINLAKENYNYLYIELASFVTIAYLSLCAYYTVFKIRVFNYYYIASHHQTDANSLLFAGILLCRLTPPLCLNFLGLIHLDSHVTADEDNLETSYTQIMGHMDVISFIADGFNIYFPIAIVLLCFATYFNLGTRCLHFLGFQQFVGDDDMTQDFVDEGREIVKRERRKIERRLAGETRRRQWNERYGDDQSASESDTAARFSNREQGIQYRPLLAQFE
ncbi:LMBR1 domain-containing protein 2 [Lingula anatina]|uniref:LMBR1 domain-containing protein 2 n=1 Tax=Lingula anatina TaxID=7574 RepID=A0A1S3JF92_LINAN|nr:LMBR1 domain-containing protein 2 [Lingula anatina]|eukprot:XP_013409008.1 LMBR1 domain-containing protein 2 [Lingula anatina]